MGSVGGGGEGGSKGGRSTFKIKNHPSSHEISFKTVSVNCIL